MDRLQIRFMRIVLWMLYLIAVGMQPSIEVHEARLKLDEDLRKELENK